MVDNVPKRCLRNGNVGGLRGVVKRLDGSVERRIVGSGGSGHDDRCTSWRVSLRAGVTSKVGTNESDFDEDGLTLKVNNTCF